MLDGITPLHAAFMNQHKVVKALIEAHADVNVRIKNSGKTALMSGASGWVGDLDAVIVDSLLLITAAADVNEPNFNERQCV